MRKSSLEDGGFLLAGRSFGDITDPLSGETNFRVIRIDAEGDKIWDRTYGSMRGDYLNQAIRTDDGGFLLTGTSAGTGGDRAEEPRGSSWDYWAVKIDSGGNLEWETAIAGFGTDYHQSVAQGADGGFLLGGFSSSPAKGDKSEGPKGYTVIELPNGEIDSIPTLDYWVVKLDAAGNILWDQTIGGSEDDNLQVVEATPDGGYLLGGSSKSDAGGDKTEDTKGEHWWNTDIWIVKIDSEGNIEWDNSIGGVGSEGLVAIQPVAGGGYLLAGNSDSPASGDRSEDPEEGQRFWLVWIDEQGNVLKDQNLGRDNARLSTVASASDHNYLLGAWIEGNSGWDDFYVVKIKEETSPAPTAGHITGGGWFHSPAGAYEPDPQVAGRAIFSFNARQKKGEEALKGNVTFILPDARLVFHSRSIDWLSVDENKAFIKGSGMIGREEGYHFLLSIVDHGQGIHSKNDHLRVIIWDREDNLVYDNQRGDARYAEARMPIHRGNIIIHDKQRNGHAVSGRIEEESVSGEMLQGLKAYPTHLSQEGLWLEIPAMPGRQELQLSIYDMQGRKMAEKTIVVREQGEKQLWKPGHQTWSPGIYLLRVEGEELNHRQRLIK